MRSGRSLERTTNGTGLPSEYTLEHYILIQGLTRAELGEQTVAHEVMISAFSSAYTQEVLSLSRRLEEDALPCSFWSLDEQSVARLLQHAHKQTVVALSGRTRSTS